MPGPEGRLQAEPIARVTRERANKMGAVLGKSEGADFHNMKAKC